MKILILPKVYCLQIKFPGDLEEKRINLRNYIFRKSKHVKSNAYAFESIVPVEPEKLRISI